MLVVSFGNREGYSGICDSDGCGGCESHSVHILGGKERLRFQLPGTISLWCYHCAYGLCNDSGIVDLHVCTFLPIHTRTYF